MGCWFGCCSKSMPVIAVDEPSKGLRIQGRSVIKSSLSDDFLSTTCEIYQSISSIGGTNIQPEFVNYGLLRWNQLRLEWVDHKKSENRAEAQEPVLSYPTVYVVEGTLHMKVYSVVANTFLNQFLSQKWLDSWWTYGSTKDCMIKRHQIP